ncbi:hypothetical protein TNCV_2496221 [Trichonephila clavipes]|nr:hypothetical protein TNCV_2496221 [Trichonephila clavipes]
MDVCKRIVPFRGTLNIRRAKISLVRVAKIAKWSWSETLGRNAINSSSSVTVDPQFRGTDADKISRGYKFFSIGVVWKFDGDRFNSCQVIYSQFGLAIHQNDHQAKRRFVEWAQNEMAVVPDFHKRILFSDEAHFWLNGYVKKQNCLIWSEANPQVYVETPLHPEKLTVWCALWAGGILLQKR